MNRIKNLNWSSSQVADFWDYISSSEVRKEDYFTKYYGEYIVNFLHYLAPLNGKILDYGCGIGFMSEELLKKEISCQGCDFSESSVNCVNEKFTNNPLWHGAKLINSSTLPYEDNSIDLIICIETIEHILDEFLEPTLQEFYRVLKPNTGKLFVTTPNNEDLEKSMIFCPNCHSLFHNYQHVRSLNISSLSELLESHRLQTDLCNATNFALFKPRRQTAFLDWSLRKIDVIIGFFIVNTLERLKLYQHPLSRYLFNKRLDNTRPHLFWIGGK